jgi:hypothetical protein
MMSCLRADSDLANQHDENTSIILIDPNDVERGLRDFETVRNNRDCVRPPIMLRQLDANV